VESADHIPAGAPRLIVRLGALLAALREGPLARPALLARLGAAYPPADSGRRMLERDVAHLHGLGITVERSKTRPPICNLRGGLPVFDPEELRALALIRDTFGDRHPLAAQVQALLDRLTTRLTPTEQRAYHRRQAAHAPVQPAIDYTPYAATIEQLEQAIGQRRMVAFRYQRGGGTRPTLHSKVEPYEIEYYERHFYLVAYTHLSS
jgi:predicted DNA-binding transcriptional regulator YafY